MYFQQGSQNILLKQKSDSSYPSSSQNLADFSFTTSKARGLAFAPDAWHEWGSFLPFSVSPLTPLPSHAVTATLAPFLFLKHLRAHSQPSGSLYSLFSPSRMPLPHARHAPSLPSESNVTFSWRPFLIELFKIAVLLPQPCHSLTCFIYLRSIYHQLTRYIFICSSSVSSH